MVGERSRDGFLHRGRCQVAHRNRSEERHRDRAIVGDDVHRAEVSFALDLDVQEVLDCLRGRFGVSGLDEKAARES